MRTQRDAYAHLHNEELHHANKGVTINEIHNVYQQPESLKNQWAARSYHGSEEHNSRAVINRYLGYWDANPATLIPLSPAESAPLYVEMIGGGERIIAKGQELYEQGKYLSAIEILNKLVYTEPTNQTAKDLLADAFEQVGYQKESPSVRNSFLAAAFVLRNGFPSGVTSQPGHGAGDVHRPAARLPIEINRSDLELIMSGLSTFPELANAGKVKLEGDASIIQKLQDILVQFSSDFEIMPGTLPARQPRAGNHDLFEQPEPASSAGG
ncbi:MAG: hypothetical protein RLZZ609_2504 [Cyanobacteriota bacterium]|jgi:alkyl sulfatase BDS1-like metallo-beta-lactamase superfamily hydrolase